ncbi:MAG: UvrD-helicase domain-containing protein [Acidobacteria bacterium]|nr:UvrD-helicase domain-containing protein [Acidobacteriota bacterium]
MNNTAAIIQVQAGAGSGKTYELSRRYIEILTKLFENPPQDNKRQNQSCHVDSPGNSGPESVLAITFTNKAAAEMKERILYFLKRIAFGDNPAALPGFAKLKQETAAALLTAVLRDFSGFQVKTIDSFMNNILKAFAVDAGLFPDFKLEFNTDDIFALSIETMFDTRPDLLPQLKGMLEAVLKQEDGQSGFDPRRLTEKLLGKLKNFESNIEFSRLSAVPPYDSAAALNTLKQQAIKLIEEMEKPGPGIFNGRSFTPDTHRSQIDRYGKFPKWMIDGRSLDDLKNKRAEVPALGELQEKLNTFRSQYREYLISKEVEAFRAPVRVFHEYLKLEKQFLKELNSFEISKMAPVIHRLLQLSGAPAAFCRLGEQYQHYLIDEFQDTSRSQWDAMVPLIANSLSKGGSLFFVGDTKQAIYGWRGGDYRLFHEIPQQKEIRLPAGENFEQHTLDTNFRSAKEIVTFNNALFSETGISELETKLKLPGLMKIYEHACQKTAVPPREGMVTARLFQSADKDARAAETEKWSREIIRDTADRLGAGSILILARSREKVRTISGWLVDMNIPFVSEDSLKLFGSLTVKSLLALLASMVLPSPDNYLFGLVETGFFGKLEPGQAALLLRKHRNNANREIPARQFLKENAPEFYKKWLAPLDKLRAAYSGYELATRLIRHLQLEQSPDRSLIDRFLEEILLLEENGITDTVDIINYLYENTDEISLSMPETKEVVRIMTIHKAKGLESPVVIIPFLDWKLVKNNNIVIGEAGPGSGKYLQIKKTIAELDPELGKIYRDAKQREAIESINIMYVALTRAGRELYIGMPQATGQMENSNICGIFQQMMEKAGLQFSESGIFSAGKPGKSAGKTEQADKMDPLPPFRDASELLSFADTKDEPFEFEARLRGTLLHKALSFILHIENTNRQYLDKTAETALNRAAAALGIAPELQKDNINAISRILLALNPWFSPELPAWNEKEFVGTKGEMIRVDRLVREKEHFILIDYKTGKPNPGHHRQLNHYTKILQPLGKPVKAVLAYLDTGEVHHVRA